MCGNLLEVCVLHSSSWEFKAALHMMVDSGKRFVLSTSGWSIERFLAFIQSLHPSIAYPLLADLLRLTRKDTLCGNIFCRETSRSVKKSQNSILFMSRMTWNFLKGTFSIRRAAVLVFLFILKCSVAIHNYLEKFCKTRRNYEKIMAN